MKNKKILILELGDKVIKVCRVGFLKKKRFPEYLEAFSFEGDISSLELEEALSLARSKFKYDKIIFSLSRMFFLIRYINLPSQDINEIKKMLPFQLAKHILYPLEEVVYDFSVIERNEEGVKVLVFIIPQKKITYLIDVLKKRRIIPAAVTFTSAGIANWVKGHNIKEFSQGNSLVIDVDKGSCEVLAVNKGIVVFSRVFDYERTNITQGVKQSLKIFDNQIGHIEFDKVIFTGIKKEELPALDFLSNPIFIDSRGVVEGRRQVEERTAAADFSFVSVLGLATLTVEPQFNFLPKFLKDTKDRIAKKKKWIKFFIISLQILFILGSFYFLRIYEKYKYLEFLNSKLGMVKIEANELDTIADKINLLSRRVERKTLFSDILYDLIHAVPVNIQLTHLDFQENKDFFIKGCAAGDTDVFELKTSLNNSEFFKNVSIKYISKIKDNKGKMIVEFYMYGVRK